MLWGRQPVRFTNREIFMEGKKVGIMETVLRDAHQSLLATRMRTEDMLPIAAEIDKVGFWSVELWGGATFDACIRYLGEDPWERLRRFRKALPNTRTQMLLRGQNMLGYRHYADDVVDAFVEKAAGNGMDVFRIFDAMNDMRNVEAAVRAVLKTDRHAQGAISYTISPVHTMDTWIDLGKRLEDMGCHSVCIKDMAGLIKPYVAEEMVSKLKEALSAPIALHSHATTGMSTAAIVKAVEAGADMADAAISSMSHTYGHSATESVVAILEGGDRDTGMDLGLLEEIASYFRGVRKKYAKFEGSLRGIDARILTAQVPGGMLTNMENQLREQGATDRFDEVLEEMPSVRQELGFIPLVTPTSQIVGTQSIVNVLSGERYKTITRQTAGVLRGEYGRTPAPVDADLQKRALDGDDPVTCRPADRISPEMGKLTAEVDRLAREEGFRRADDPVEDVLTYALFDQVGLKFLKNRNDSSAFEPPPWEEAPAPSSSAAPAEAPAPAADIGPARYRVNVNGTAYDVEVSPEGAVDSIQPARPPAPAPAPAPTTAPAASGEALPSPLSGTVRAVRVQPGQTVAVGDVVIVLEAMKMETNVIAPRTGRVVSVAVQEGGQVGKGDPLLYIS
jgi:oxaloacetate decarboxylase alpha subunit